MTTKNDGIIVPLGVMLLIISFFYNNEKLKAKTVTNPIFSR